ncbi:malto-oligosyltrehalose trehalohydrolase [Microbacterium halimionae]|uniref:malto-oligosyltrehalose trehalohydrolase n=1 Tax=Microbacterium halimionae TaxID=1526413 RepID=UPI001423E54F|nr:malto-oligosyltrehalose trehalohydrolase [Microbacterium halimionae]NII94741.1 maltooligosyltrehalose trehalohydrolase [Microbacterium halimionae]
MQVWAPRAERVRLRMLQHGAAESNVVEDLEMTRGADGWWDAAVQLSDGDEYGFVLGDGDDLLPDPRSMRQPHGVHEASAFVDPGAFTWTDDAWTGKQLAGGLIYELHIGTFTPEGTLDAAISRFDHLIELGVTHIELLPVNGFNGTWNWGYDGVAWYTVHEAYGGPAAYVRFVDAAHNAGLAVIQDVVYNHLGPSGNYLPEFGPYLRDGSRNTWGDSVNLDDAAVRAYIVENTLMWLRDYHVDGLRLDAVHALHDEQPVHILQEMAEASDVLSAHVGRPLTLIAESDMNDPKLILPREAGGYGLTAQWSDDWHHAAHVALTGETVGYYEDFAALEALPKVWMQGFFHNGTFSSFRERAHGFPIPETVPAWRLVTFAQDHDQIGNRAAGDRLSQSLSYGRLAVAAVLTMTAPGTPMLFMGEEWGASTPWQFFTSHPEEWLGEAVRKGRTAEFEKMGWDESVVPDPQDPATFERSKLAWHEAAEGDHARLLKLYRSLARLRRDRPELTDPAFANLTAQAGESADGSVAGRTFRLGRGDVSVFVNLSDAPVSWRAAKDTSVLLRTDAAVAIVDGRLTLPAATAAVVD